MTINVTGAQPPLITALNNFANSPTGGQTYASTLAYILNKNPAAASQLNNAFQTGAMNSRNAFTVVGLGQNVGVEYNSLNKQIILDPSTAAASAAVSTNDPLNANAITLAFQFFHEIWHADNASSDQRALTTAESVPLPVSGTPGNYSMNLDSTLTSTNAIFENMENRAQLQAYDGLANYFANSGIWTDPDPTREDGRER